MADIICQHHWGRDFDKNQDDFLNPSGLAVGRSQHPQLPAMR